MALKNTTTPITIRFNDIDLAGHVHNSVYLHYFELGRIDFFNTLISEKRDWKKEGVIIGRNEIDYLRPITFQDDLYINTFTENIGNKSITVGYNVFIKQNKQEITCAKGKSVLVCFNFETNKSVEVFEEWKKVLM